MSPGETDQKRDRDSFMSKAVNFVVNHVFDVVEWDKAAYQVAAHRSSFGELVCLFIAPVSCVSFYPFKMNCVFVCKFGESFMAVIDGLVVVYFIGESLNEDRLSLQKVICWLLKVMSSSAACLMAAVSAWKTVQ